METVPEQAAKRRSPEVALRDPGRRRIKPMTSADFSAMALPQVLAACHADSVAVAALAGASRTGENWTNLAQVGQRSDTAVARILASALDAERPVTAGRLAGRAARLPTRPIPSCWPYTRARWRRANWKPIVEALLPALRQGLAAIRGATSTGSAHRAAGSDPGNRRPLEPDARDGRRCCANGRSRHAAGRRPIGPASFSGIGRHINWSAGRPWASARASCAFPTTPASSDK